ncbi:L,D-transpeptidase [Myceligenerans crystallogenes]|uniref:L,D-TPase catalytic domain-containing protein n=1 Tax=Myceligenerans crystallogenes TaxID=316335 RepID=A0ABN2NA93_9MICO
MNASVEQAGTRGDSPGSGLRPGWIAALVAGVAMLVVIAVTAAFTVFRDQPASDSGEAVASVPSLSPGQPASREPRVEPADFDLRDLSVPTIESVFPAMPRTRVSSLGDLPGKVAVPARDLTPVWAAADVSKRPRLALAATQYDYAARWLVLDTKNDMVKVLLPYGRGALPSADPEAVNGVSGWLRTKDVTIEREDRSIVIDLSDRVVEVDTGDGPTTTLPAGIGTPATPTPQGLTQVMTVTTASNTGLSLFLSAQSESLDTFAGVNYAATALHVGVGQGQEISNGCIRLTPEGLDAVKDLPAGVPVLVRA